MTGDRNSYHNQACRELMRCHRSLAQAETYEAPIVRLILRRMADTSLQAVRFKYRQPSTWDIL